MLLKKIFFLTTIILSTYSSLSFASPESDRLYQIVAQHSRDFDQANADNLRSSDLKKIDNYKNNFDKLIRDLNSQLKKEPQGSVRHGELSDVLKDAYYAKGKMLLDAAGPRQNLRTQAKESLKSARQLGHPSASTALFLAYKQQVDNGRRVKHSTKQGLFYLVEAEEKGDLQATVLLAKDYDQPAFLKTQDQEKARALYKQAAELGDPYSQYRFAQMVVNGLGAERGKPPEYELAKTLLEALLQNPAAKPIYDREFIRPEAYLKTLNDLLAPGPQNQDRISPNQGQTQEDCNQPVNVFIQPNQLSQRVEEVAQKLEEIAPQDQVISTCCGPVRTGDAAIYSTGNPPRIKNYAVIEPFHKDWDPYSTGPRNQQQLPSWSFNFTDKKHYQFNKQDLATIGSSQQIPQDIGYKIPPYLNGEKETDYYQRRLESELSPNAARAPVNDRVTFAGRGSQSQVYWVHDPIPSNETLAKLFPDKILLQTQFPGKPYDEARRTLWASNNAKEVLKLRNPNPWGKKSETATDQARRDIALQEIFDSYAKRFFLKNPGQPPKQIIEVVKYKNDENQIGRGVFRQEAVHGETAYEIARRIKSALAGDKNQEKFLINQLKFKNLQEVQLHINVLENFYRETHNDVINFQIQNGIDGVSGYTYSGEVRRVGFDYNLGQNVKWDPEKQIFRAFDL